MERRCVRSRNLENEEDKGPLQGCGKYNQKGCNAKKTNKQTNIPGLLMLIIEVNYSFFDFDLENVK